MRSIAGPALRTKSNEHLAGEMYAPKLNRVLPAFGPLRDLAICCAKWDCPTVLQTRSEWYAHCELQLHIAILTPSMNRQFGRCRDEVCYFAASARGRSMFDAVKVVR